MRTPNASAVEVCQKENRLFLEKGLSDLKGTRYLWLYLSENLHEKYRESYEELKKL